jgi:hypothetical protein
MTVIVGMSREYRQCDAKELGEQMRSHMESVVCGRRTYMRMEIGLALRTTGGGTWHANTKTCVRGTFVVCYFLPRRILHRYGL